MMRFSYMPAALMMLFASQIMAVGVEGSNINQEQSINTSSQERSMVFLSADERLAESPDESDESELAFFDQPLLPSKRSFELNRKMASAMQPGGANVVASVTTGDGRLNAGRSMMMSAMIPGAGEFYLAHNTYNSFFSYLKAGVFFAAEVGFWYGAITYAMRGEDKEAEFELFADQYWNEDVYRGFEYWLAKNYQTEDRIFDGENEQEWLDLGWEEKLDYLPTWFTHELPEEKDQQYYEMIGKYLQQFGVGWDGEYEGWSTGQIAFYTRYDRDKWDGYNPYQQQYGDMRYDSNQLLDVSAGFFMSIMVNHVVSALDAGFSVQLYNRSLRTQMGMDFKRFNGQDIAMGEIKLKF